MKILLFDAVNIKSVYINLGFSQIASILRQNGHELEYFSIAWDKDKLREDKLKKYKFDLILVSCLSSQYYDMLHHLKSFKKIFKVPILVGGVHPTVSPMETISNREIDAICIGEGDYAIAEFCDKLENGQDVTNVRNIWIKQGKNIIENDIRPLAQNLDEFPFPDRELFKVKRNIMFGGGRTNVMFGRGCPFKCTYCINHYLQNLYRDKGKYLRMKSPEYAIEELKDILRKYEIGYFVFNDDTLIFFKEWLKKFLKIYRDEIGIPFSVTGRVELANDEICQLLRDSGCDSLWMGIESGNMWIRENILDRHYTNEQVINAFKIAKKYGLGTKAYNMVGIPYEGPEEIMETIRLNLEVDADLKYVKILQPYDGTDIRSFCEKHDLIVGDVKKINRLDEVYKLGAVATGKMNRYEVLASLYMWDIWTKKNMIARIKGHIGYQFYKILGLVTNVLFNNRGKIKYEEGMNSDLRRPEYPRPKL